MNRPPILCVLGNSVPLLIQPFRKSDEEKTYSEHLRDTGVAVINSSKEAVMLSDIYWYLEDECIRYFPDFVILNFGIVECTYRARTRWLQHFFANNAWNNSIVQKGYNGPLKRIVKFVLKEVYKTAIEKPLYALHLKYRWLRPLDYKFILKDVTRIIFRDTPVKKIIILGMLPVSEWVEKKAPGTQKSVKEFNMISQEVAVQYENIIYLDPQILTAHMNPQDISLDGIHYTAAGHAIIAATIQKYIPEATRTDYDGWGKLNQYVGLNTFYENWYKRFSSRSK